MSRDMSTKDGIMAVHIETHTPDWNELAWPVLLRLGAAGHCPGKDEDLLRTLFARLRSFPELGTRFLNPRYTVSSQVPSREFVRQARRAQTGWLMQARDVLGGAAILQRELHHSDRLLRQLRFTGLLIVNGKHVGPAQWPSEPARLSRIQIGQRFGRLMVLEKLPGGKWRCRCDCGSRNDVRTKHLLRGHIRSCGCLKQELEARQRKGKATRAFINTGIILDERQ